MLLSKHYYSKVGELEEGGEEFLCAQTLDQMDEVEFWVRNLERQEKFSFWLQTSTDKFYPDFVCKLKDGRYLVVEYKGADRWSNDDSKEAPPGRTLGAQERGEMFVRYAEREGLGRNKGSGQKK